LLNISQAAVVGGGGSLFIPGIGEQFGLVGPIAAMVFALILYTAAIYVGKEVKNDK